MTGTLIGEESVVRSIMECTICLSDITGPKKTLLCNHSFCTPCLRQWFEKADTCPTCRGRLYFRGMLWEKPPAPELIDEYIHNTLEELDQIMDTYRTSSRWRNAVLRELADAQVTHNVLKHVYEEDDEVIECALEENVYVSPIIRYKYYNDPVKDKLSVPRRMVHGYTKKPWRPKR